MIRYAIYILLLFASFNVQAKSLYVHVVDEQNKQGIDGVFISYIVKDSPPISYVTDVKGKVVIQDVHFPCELILKIVGFESKKISLNEHDVKQRNGDVEFEITLENSQTKISEVVVTGQAIPVLAKNSIYKVNSISATQIQQRGGVSLSDILNYEIGQFISNDNILGSSVSMGGIGGQNVKILVNGIPVNGRENGNVDVSQINLANIKKVEMIQGPMSVMYGSNALGGVINLISQQPKKGFTVGARTYLESIGKYNFSGNLNYCYKRHGIQLSVARNFFQGWTPTDSLDRYQIWKPKTQYTADAQYVYQAKKWNLNYYTSYVHEKITNKGIPIVNSFEGYAFDEYYTTQRLMNALSTNIHISSTDQISLVNSYSIYYRIKNRFRKDLVSLEQYPTLSVGDQDTSRFNNINLRGTYSTTRFKHFQLLGGYEYTQEVGKSYKLAETLKEYQDLGLFVSSLYNYKKLSIQPSLRVTFANQYNPAWTPAIHAKYPLDSSTQWRASYARGFRAPTLKEKYLQFIDQNHTIIGNPDLKPETGDHYEMSLERIYNTKLFSGLLSANAYHNRIDNLITLAVYNGHGVLRRYENIEHYQNWILNLKGSMVFKNLNIQQGAGFTFVEKSNTLPQHIVFEYALGVVYNINYIHSALNFNYKFNSKQVVRTIEDQYLFTDPIHIANVSLQRSFFKNAFLVQAGVKNLFNLQNTSLSGMVDNQGSAHTSASGMQMFPARSLFFDLQYRLSK